MADQKQLENEEYFNCLGSLITNDQRCKREIVVNPALVDQNVRTAANITV